MSFHTRKNRVVEYVESHPGCSNTEIHKNVCSAMPNHFFSAMMSSLCAAGKLRCEDLIDYRKYYAPKSTVNTSGLTG